MRILIIGSPGAGKSVFTNKIASHLKLPVFHLDDFYWLKDWSKPTNANWLTILDRLIKKENWIIDGNYFDSLDKRLARADYVIYLDYSTGICLYRAFKRLISRRLFSCESLPIVVREDKSYIPKIKLDLRFITLILTFKVKYKHRIISLFGKHNISYFLLRSPKEATCFIKQLCNNEIRLSRLSL
jgi:hypothetical protein